MGSLNPVLISVHEVHDNPDQISPERDNPIEFQSKLTLTLHTTVKQLQTIL